MNVQRALLVWDLIQSDICTHITNFRTDTQLDERLLRKKRLCCCRHFKSLPSLCALANERQQQTCHEI